MQKNKKYLLGCAESAAKFINESGSGNFINLLLDIIEAAEGKFQDEHPRKQYFCEIILDNKNSKIDKFLGGGKTLSDSFSAFIKDFLQIYKVKEEYVIKNRGFQDLTMEELKYVLGWTRRLIEKKSNTDRAEEVNNKDEKQLHNRNPRNNNSGKKEFSAKQSNNQTRSYKDKNKEPFNDALAVQLGFLYKNNV